MQNERLDPKIQVHRFGQNQESTYRLTTDVDWIGELLEELQEGLDKEDRPDAGDLQLELTLANKENSSLKEHFVVKGRFFGKYHAACVRCLAPATRELDCDFACCFLAEHLEKAPEYEEATEIYCDEQNMDLYFTGPRGSIDLKELIHEQIFMRIDPLPLHDENCKGLCMTCGTNLNTDTCGH